MRKVKRNRKEKGKEPDMELKDQRTRRGKGERHGRVK